MIDEFSRVCLGIFAGLLMCKIVDTLFPNAKPPTTDPPDYLPCSLHAGAPNSAWRREHEKNHRRFPVSECPLCLFIEE